MWEGGQALDTYGTSLALMLLPYWTNGRIASMEGLYYESAATTPYHFMAVAPLSGPGNASNPVRGLDYRTIDGLRPRRALPAAARRPLLHGVLDRGEGAGRRQPGPRAGRAGSATATARRRRVGHLRGARSATVPPLRYEPVVVNAALRDAVGVLRPPSRCRAQKIRELGAWECLAAGWWNDPDALDRPLAAGGPPSWARVAGRTRRRRAPDAGSRR